MGMGQAAQRSTAAEGFDGDVGQVRGDLDCGRRLSCWRVIRERFGDDQQDRGRVVIVFEVFEASAEIELVETSGAACSDSEWQLADDVDGKRES